MAGKDAKTIRVVRGKRPAPSLDEYVIVDVETTGLQREEADIIEIGALLVENSEILAAYTSVVAFDRSSYVPRFVVELTGITTQMVREQGVDADIVMSQFLEFAGERPLVAHNASFDYRFLQTALERCNEKRLERGIESLEPLRNLAFDTLSMSRKLYPNVSHRLGDLADMLGIDTTGAHRALKDCYITYGLLQSMMQHPDWDKWFKQRTGWVKKTLKASK